jgi:hypothetical protein
MYLRLFTNIFFIIFLSIFQIAFISALPAWFNNINFLILILIFILSFKGFLYGFWWAFGTGLILEIYSFFPFGIHIFSLMCAIMVANFLLINFLTNRSLYSYLAISLSAIFVYEFLFYFLNLFISYFNSTNFFFNFNKNFILDKFSVLLINAFIMVILFYFVNFISKNFQPVFLIRNSVKK